jgi:FixJ family two-component response regulator
MFALLNTPSMSSVSDEIETLCPDEDGIDCLDHTTFHRSLGIEHGSKTAPWDTICVVDDDPLVLRSVGRLLESAGLGAITFSEPGSFLEYAAENSVPLAILDIWMEQMTGMELLAHLCAKSPRTRVIFMSGHEDLAAKATVMQAGALAFFIKPFHNDYFLNVVRRALGYSLPSMKGAEA